MWSKIVFRTKISFLSDNYSILIESRYTMVGRPGGCPERMIHDTERIEALSRFSGFADRIVAIA